MNQKEFSQRLARNEIPSLLLFEGPEEYLKQNALRELREKILPPGLEELNEARMQEPSADELRAAAETLPFGADRRLILLRDHPALIGRKEAEEDLLNYLGHVPETAVVLFYCVQEIKKNKKLYRAISKHGQVVSFPRMAARDLTSFITKAFQEQGRECDMRTADLLIFTCGTDLNQLRSEVAKISALHPEDPRVDPRDVQALATPSAESKVFRMIDHVIAGEEGKAFAELRNLLQSRENNRVGILYMLLRQYRILQQIQIMRYERKSDQEIGEALGMQEFIVRQYLRQAKMYTGPQVKEAVNICLTTDYEIKSGALRDEGALEAAMLKLMMLRKS